MCLFQGEENQIAGTRGDADAAVHCVAGARGDADAAAHCVASPPFGCLWKNIFFGEDILICSQTSEEPILIAYQIVKGKVQRYQLLVDIMQHLSKIGAFLCDNFVDLGGGYICYEYHTSSNDGQKSSLTFVTFKVSKIDGGDDHSSGFLRCERLKTVTREIKG